MKSKKINITGIEKYLILLLFLYVVNTLPSMGAISYDSPNSGFDENNPYTLRATEEEDDDMGGPPHDDLPVPPVPVGDEMLSLGLLILLYGGAYLLKKDRNVPQKMS